MIISFSLNYLNSTLNKTDSDTKKLHE